MCIFMWQASLGVTSSLLRIHPFAKCLLPIDLRFQADLRQTMFVSYICIHNGFVDTKVWKKCYIFKSISIFTKLHFCQSHWNITRAIPSFLPLKWNPKCLCVSNPSNVHYDFAHLAPLGKIMRAATHHCVMSKSIYTFQTESIKPSCLAGDTRSKVSKERSWKGERRGSSTLPRGAIVKISSKTLGTKLINSLGWLPLEAKLVITSLNLFLPFSKSKQKLGVELK